MDCAENALSSSRRPDRVFVGGLPDGLSDVALADCFANYGTIVESVVMRQKKTNRPRGFGFVRFTSDEAVERVMEDYHHHHINGKWVEVKRTFQPVGRGPESAFLVDRGALSRLASLRAQRVLRYDTAEYPFQTCFHDMCEIDEPLETFHKKTWPENAPCPPFLHAAFLLAGIQLGDLSRAAERSRYMHFVESSAFKRFLDLYHRFVEEIILPLSGDRCGVVYQCPPTLRCHLPCSRMLGKLHKDGDYPDHHEHEVNVWIPVTDTLPGNTLHLESAPERGDFQPLLLKYGEAMIFDGYNCWHHTVPNDTDGTRMSFDFRFIPRSLVFQEPRLKIGHYPSAVVVPQVVEPKVAS